MNLINRFNNKLISIKTHAEKANATFHGLKNLLQDFIAKEILDEELIRVFALKENELSILKSKLEKLIIISSTFEKHKDIILSKDSIIAEALKLIDNVEDELINLTAEIKSIILFLESKVR